MKGGDRMIIVAPPCRRDGGAASITSPAPAISKLSERQRACLRLVWQNYEAKEIARALDISPHAVHERLRDARRLLSVQSSREAARLLAVSEQLPKYTLKVDDLIGVEPLPENAPSISLSNGQTGSAENVARGGLIREDQTLHRMAAFAGRMKFSLPFPTMEKPHNDLTFTQTLTLILLIAIALAFSGISSVAFVDQLAKIHIR